MWLLVGLGNPGPGHARNRHNIGFMAVDEIARRHGFGPWKIRFQGLAAEGSTGGEKVLALKPTTYMNLSGQAAAAALRFGCNPKMIVIPTARPAGAGEGSWAAACRPQRARSLDAHVGRDYWRVRLGIGHPGAPELVHDYILHDFARADETWIKPLIEAVAEAFPLLVAGDDGRFLNKVVVLTSPPKPAKPRPAPTEDGPADGV
jgi:PTH1 family peptidyl-tRNA hydrolase